MKSPFVVAITNMFLHVQSIEYRVECVYTSSSKRKMFIVYKAHIENKKQATVKNPVCSGSKKTRNILKSRNYLCKCFLIEVTGPSIMSLGLLRFKSESFPTRKAKLM